MHNLDSSCKISFLSLFISVKMSLFKLNNYKKNLNCLPYVYQEPTMQL